MDTPDSEIQFNHGQGDQESIHESPGRNDKGQIEDRQYDRHDRFNRNSHCCYGQRRSSIVIKPDPFTGYEDWEQYISHFEDCAELGQWNEREMLLTLAASLKGQARVFYSSLPTTAKRNYENLTSLLEQRFGSTRQQSRWLSKFQTRSRLQGESAADFGDELCLLARKAYVSLESEAQELLALQQFCKALPIEMRCRIMDRDCKTISEAVEVVERYEELLGESHSSTNGRYKGNVRQAQVTNPGNEYIRSNYKQSSPINQNDLERTLKSIQYRLDRIERNRQPKSQDGPRKCFICQSTDHLYRSCPNNLNSPKRNPQYQAQGNEEPPSQ